MLMTSFNNSVAAQLNFYVLHLQKLKQYLKAFIF